MISVGEKAPDFLLNGAFGDKTHAYSLNTLKSNWVALFFYPHDFDPVCESEIRQLRAFLKDFTAERCVVVGISTDYVVTHKEWVEKLGNLHFPLLSDTKGTVARSYGVWNDEKEAVLRAHLIIDTRGVVRYAAVCDGQSGQDQSVDAVLQALHALRADAGA